ncbi:MAG: tRNA (guanosine(37)-N1)-methyltransferase TrmD [Christensenellaceae bacterium]
MRIDILTLFPEMFAPLSQSIIGRARDSKIVDINVHDIRDYTENKHRRCDDYPFGGGAGMVMMAQPIASCIDSIDKDHNAYRIFMSPKGAVFNQKMVQPLLDKQWLILLCGHYEGVDQRVLDLYFDAEISIGDYVLTGGELPAMVVTDCLLRYVDGVITRESLNEESFSADLLEYPQYTRPESFMGLSVPEVLLSGHHKKIEDWRREQSLKITKEKRPDLLK